MCKVLSFSYIALSLTDVSVPEQRSNINSRNTENCLYGYRRACNVHVFRHICMYAEILTMNSRNTENCICIGLHMLCMCLDVYMHACRSMCHMHWCVYGHAYICKHIFAAFIGCSLVCIKDSLRNIFGYILYFEILYHNSIIYIRFFMKSFIYYYLR